MQHPYFSRQPGRYARSHNAINKAEIGRNKKPAFCGFSGLSWMLLDIYMVELSGIEFNTAYLIEMRLKSSVTAGMRNRYEIAAIGSARNPAAKPHPNAHIKKKLIPSIKKAEQ